MQGRVALIISISGPAGVGKGKIVEEILRLDPNFRLAVSATTRQPRVGEMNGVHYYFLSEEEFQNLIASGGFLEWANVHGSAHYGTPESELQRLGSHNIILEIDLQGVRQVRDRIPQLITFFVLPPSLDELKRRLRERGSETEEQIASRLATAERELAAAGEFDFAVVNDDVSSCARQIISLAKAG